jgi:hypothetical protein
LKTHKRKKYKRTNEWLFSKDLVKRIDMKCFPDFKKDLVNRFLLRVADLQKLSSEQIVEARRSKTLCRCCESSSKVVAPK